VKPPFFVQERPDAVHATVIARQYTLAAEMPHGIARIQRHDGVEVSTLESFDLSCVNLFVGLPDITASLKQPYCSAGFYS
jgi:hypothetical protein